VFVRYMPLILQGKPVLLNKRDMFDADLNRLPPDEQEAVYAKMVPAPGRQGRQMFGVSVSPKKVSGPQLIRRYAHVSPTESDPIGRVELALCDILCALGRGVPHVNRLTATAK